MKICICTLFVSLAITTWGQSNPVSSGETRTVITSNKLPSGKISDNLLWKIINAPNGTFGYDIIKDGTTLITQPNIPGLPGVEGFKSIGDAVKIAKLVGNKIDKQIYPPVVTTEELEKLGIIINQKNK